MPTKIDCRRGHFAAFVRRCRLGAGFIACVIAFPALANAGDLSITKNGTPDPVLAGTTLTYSLSVKNNGPGEATGVVVTDTLPGEVVFLGDNCVDGGAPVNGVLTCPLDPIPATNTVVINISVAVSSAAKGTFVNTASVTGAEADLVQGNNSATFTSTVLTGSSVDQGSATKVGLIPDPSGGEGAIRVSGKFSYPGPLVLEDFQAIQTAILAENGPGGAGELVAGLPKTLPFRQSRPGAALYGTSGSERPSIRLEVRERPRNSGNYEYRLQVKRIGIPLDPVLCSQPDPEQPFQTTLTTSFKLQSPIVGSEPLTISGTGVWNCQLAEDKMRVFRGGGGGGGGGGGDGEPKAKLVTEPLTRNQGVPNEIELDGSKSSDKNGTIVTYEFAVRSRETGSVVYGPTLTTDTRVVALIAPGDYRASLTVTDDTGQKNTDERGFSVK